MRNSDYPAPFSDLESEGLPETADDDSTAYDDVATGREADGPAPAEVPGDRPHALDTFGITTEEARHGESLEYRLSQEEPEIPVDDAMAEPSPRVPPETTSENPVAEEPPEAGDLVEAPVEPHVDSAVSMYDVPGAGGRPVGRLVEPDEGGGIDDEAASIAYDAGAAGGGATAEEQAIHETQPPPM